MSWITNNGELKEFKTSLLRASVITITLTSISIALNYSIGSKSMLLPILVFLFTFCISLIIGILFKVLNSISSFKRDLKFEATELKSKLLLSKIDVNLKELNNYIASPNRDSLVKQSLLELTNDYFKKFKVVNDHFTISSEEVILDAYLILWRNLIIEQKRRNKLDQPSLIARVTHSNNLRIWNDDGPRQTDDLYKLQKEFIDNGGIVVRFLGISKIDKDPDEQTKRVLNKMKDYDIPAWYVPAKKDYFEYDYLYLYEEELVLKWYTTTGGLQISRMEVVEKLEDETHKSWIDLWKLCVKLYGEETEAKLNKLIPPERQFF